MHCHFTHLVFFYIRDVSPSLLLLLVVVKVGLGAVLVLLLAVLLLPPLPELLRLLDLNLDLLEGPVMMHQEGLLVMIPLEDLLMMHKELATIHKEEPCMIHKEELSMMYIGQVMRCKEEPVMIQPGVLTMMHSPEVLLVLRDMCLQAICPMVQPLHLLLEGELGMRHRHLEEVQTQFVDEA